MAADLTMSPTRVRLTTDAIYSPARRCQKRRRCDGHLAERHWIEVGDPIYWSYAESIGRPVQYLFEDGGAE